MSCILDVRSYASGGKHVHDHAQVLVPVAGSMQLAIEGASHTIAANRLALIPTRAEHVFEPSRACRMLVLDIEPRQAEPALTLLRDQVPGTALIEPWLWRLLRQIADEVASNPMRAGDAAMLALTTLDVAARASTAEAAPQARSRLPLVLDTISRTPGRLPVATLAREAALSRSHFYARFRATTGTSPKRYQLVRMLERAAERIATSDDPIATIAHETGYESVSSFNRIFKRHFGSAPGAFRQLGRR